MAKYEAATCGSFRDFINYLDRSILDSSVSTTYEDGSDFYLGDACCAVRVYERYSIAGSSRVSLNVTVFAVGDNINVTAITSGGSQAMFFKLNTLGEQSFLEVVGNIIDNYKTQR